MISARTILSSSTSYSLPSAALFLRRSAAAAAAALPSGATSKRSFFLGKNSATSGAADKAAASAASSARVKPSYLPEACALLATNNHFSPSCFSSWGSSSGSTSDDSTEEIADEVVSGEIEEEEEEDEASSVTNTASTTDPTITHSKVSTNLDTLPITFSDISRAHVAIRSGIVRTPCIQSHFLSEIVGANIYLKTEFRQFTGSFKERGARNAILKLLQDNNNNGGGEMAGVIAASAGNHALALAYHGKELGVPVTVVMPTVAPLAKVDKCRKFGARIIIEGAHIGESKAFAETLVESEGLSYVNGYDDPPILAGAGTIGIEIIDDVPDVDAVVVPVGGAGLIAGVSCAIKTLKPETEVYGVEPEFAASYIAALEAGHPVPFDVKPTLGDGLAVPVVGPHAFEVARHYVDECVTCTEKDISLAILRLIENEKMVVEGGGASGLAALLPGGSLDRPELKGKNIVVPLCGGNIDTTVLGRVLDRGLAADHRLVNFEAVVSDRPGGIARLTELLFEEGASIKDIYHERAWLYTSIDQVRVKCVVELQGKDHAVRLKKALEAQGYPLNWDIKEDVACGSVDYHFQNVRA